MQQDLGLPAGVMGQAWLLRALSSSIHGAMHRHRELEVNVVTRGNARYVMEGRRYDLTARGMAWLFPDQEHWLGECSDDFEMWIGVFTPELVDWVARDGTQRMLRDANPEGAFCRMVAGPVVSELVRLFDEVWELGPGSDQNAGLGWLLARCWRAFCRDGTGIPRGRVHPAVIQALGEIDRADDDSLEAIALRVGVSPSHLSRLCARELGESFVSVRTRRRLERVRQLIDRDRERNLLGIALQAGFGSYAQFHRACVRYLGTGPRGVFRTPR